LTHDQKITRIAPECVNCLVRKKHAVPSCSAHRRSTPKRSSIIRCTIPRNSRRQKPCASGFQHPGSSEMRPFPAISVIPFCLFGLCIETLPATILVPGFLSATMPSNSYMVSSRRSHPFSVVTYDSVLGWTFSLLTHGVASSIYYLFARPSGFDVTCSCLQH